MPKFVRAAVALVAILAILGCSAKATPTLAPTTQPEPTATASATLPPTETPEPTITPLPSTTPPPTPVGVAPEETFASVGSVAHLQGEYAISGKAVVAGLQTLIILMFSYDGKGPQADIRLVNGDDYEHPAAVLLELESRPYEGEFLHLGIPADAGPGTADRVVVYSSDAGEVLAEGTFE